MLSGPRAIREDQAAALGSPRHRTLSLHDHHYLGPDGRPQRHRVIHVIEAMVDGVDRLSCRADTNALTVEAGQGFSGLAGEVYQPMAEVFVVDMLLAKPLAAGETATLEYSVGFRYQEPPPPEFRRVVHRPIVEQEKVTLESQFAVHRYLRLAEKSAVGFHWDW